MRLLKNFLAWLFKVKNDTGQCGGVECVEVVGKFDSPTGMKIYYNRPTSNQKLGYMYDYQNLITDDSKLRQTSKMKAKYADMAEQLIDKLWLPYAEKIFSHCEGFFDENGKPLEKKTKEEQFAAIKEYHSYYFTTLCDIAYSLNTKVKKKD